MLSQAFYVVIGRGISSLGHDIEVVDGLNSIGKMFLFQLISTLQFTSAKVYDTQIVMHTGTHASDDSLHR